MGPTFVTRAALLGSHRVTKVNPTIWFLGIFAIFTLKMSGFEQKWAIFNQKRSILSDMQGVDFHNSHYFNMMPFFGNFVTL